MNRAPRQSLGVVIEADGGSRGNPGPAGYGSVVFDAASKAVLAERKEAIGVASNNVAEYRGLIAGLEAAAELGATEVAVRMDSKLVVEQMSGRWQIRHADMRSLAQRAQELRRRFTTVTFQWIPREQNTHADRLANEAMDAAAGNPRSAATESIPASTEPTESAAQLPLGRALRWMPAAGEHPTRMVLVRHGSTAHSLARRYSGRNELPLDEPGNAQARAAASLVARYAPIAAVISSPLRRTQQTAGYISAALDVPVTTDDGFQETDFGLWEGLSGLEVEQKWPAELAATQQSLDVAPPGGESFAAVGRRVQQACDRVLAEYAGHTVVIVSHVTPIKSIIRSVLDAPPSALFSMQLDTGSISVVEYYGRSAGVLRLFNERPSV